MHIVGHVFITVYYLMQESELKTYTEYGEEELHNAWQWTEI